MDFSLTILIVDDDPTTSEILEATLKEDGFHTITAPGGAEGRAAALRNKPDLILLDLNMPDEDGYTTCSLLKRDPATADIPVIFLSSEERVSAKVTGLGLGAVDYITKPFDRDEMMARVNAQIRSRLARELQAAALEPGPEAPLPESESRLPANPTSAAGGSLSRFSAFFRRRLSHKA